MLSMLVAVAHIEFERHGAAAERFDFGFETAQRIDVRLVRIRSAPALASARAKYWPRPRLAPVTRATWPVRSNNSLLIER